MRDNNNDDAAVKAAKGGPGPFKINTGEKDGFHCKWVDDGFDYPAILADFKTGSLKARELAVVDGRGAWLAEAGGRKFTIKRNYLSPNAKAKKRKLWTILTGTPYTRLFNESWKAAGRGCGLIPRIYLIAEKFEKFRVCVDSYQITEFIEGETLPYPKGPRSQVAEDWWADLARAMTALHGFGLAHGSPHPWNLVRTENDGVRVIDLSFKGPMLFCQAHDLLDMKRDFDLDVPARGLALKIMARLVFAKYWWHMWRKRLKHRLKGGRPEDAPSSKNGCYR